MIATKRRKECVWVGGGVSSYNCPQNEQVTISSEWDTMDQGMIY